MIALVASPVGWMLVEPRALWALALALPVLAAHLVRRRRRRIVVPFVPLLVEGRGPARGSGGWRKVAEASALACRLLALAALALAWARPLAAEPPVPVPLALVIDLDVTTSAREADGRLRFAHALGLARAHVRAYADGPVSVVLADAAPRLFARDATDREALAARLTESPKEHDAAEALRPAAADADLAAALVFARELVGERGRVTALTARAVEVPAGPGAPGGARHGERRRRPGLRGRLRAARRVGSALACRGGGEEPRARGGHAARARAARRGSGGDARGRAGARRRGGGRRGPAASRFRRGGGVRAGGRRRLRGRRPRPGVARGPASAHRPRRARPRRAEALHGRAARGDGGADRHAAERRARRGGHRQGRPARHHAGGRRGPAGGRADAGRLALPRAAGRDAAVRRGPAR